MSTEIPEKIKKIYIKLGFVLAKDYGLWHAEFRVDDNNLISVGFDGTVYVHEGWTKYHKSFHPKCIRTFEADTPAKIEVLVRPLIGK
jgi:hypothetical protein